MAQLFFEGLSFCPLMKPFQHTKHRDYLCLWEMAT